MTKILIVVGSPGAGKSTLLDNKSVTRKYKVINLGDLITEVAVKRKYVKNRDQIRYLSHKVSISLQQEAARKIPKMVGNVILDTHASVEEHGRFVPGMTFETMKILKDTIGLMYIDASNDEIRERRMKDKKRNREIESNLTLDRQRDINMATLSYYSSYLNIPLYVIDNTEGKMQQSLKIFLKDASDAFDEK